MKKILRKFIKKSNNTKIVDPDDDAVCIFHELPVFLLTQLKGSSWFLPFIDLFYQLLVGYW